MTDHHGRKHALLMGNTALAMALVGNTAVVPVESRHNAWGEKVDPEERETHDERMERRVREYEERAAMPPVLTDSDRTSLEMAKAKRERKAAKRIRDMVK